MVHGSTHVFIPSFTLIPWDSGMELIIVLGSRIPSTEIHEELKKRLDLAISVATTGSKILLSGGLTNPELQKSEAKVMMEYITSRGIPESSVILEEKSLDTIGNGIFSAIIVKKIPKPEIIRIISSCYHMKRSEFIFTRCLGPSFNLDFSHCSPFTRKDIDENKSMKMAEEFFKGIQPGDIQRMQEHLFRAHPLYIRKEGN